MASNLKYFLIKLFLKWHKSYEISHMICSKNELEESYGSKNKVIKVNEELVSKAFE